MPTRISDETAARIAAAWPDLLDALAAGQVMAPVYAAAGLSADMVRCWRRLDSAREKDWDTAREQSADALADMALEVAYNDKVDPAHARVRIDTLKWAAAKRNPRAYSDKATLDVNVRTVDLTRIIEAANARLAAVQSGRIIEHEPTRAMLAELL